jgi:integrase/recombinase XerD
MPTSICTDAQQRRLAASRALRPLVRSYVEDAIARRYRPLTIANRETAARHFCYWLERSNIAIDRVDDSVIDLFARHSCRCPGNRASSTMSKPYVHCVRKFVDYLVQTGVIRKVEPVPEDARITAYGNWLWQQRGLSESTIRAYRGLLGKFLPLLGPEPQAYDAALLRRIFVAEARCFGTSHMKNVASLLRSYLRYLAVQGECSPALVQAVPSIAHWQKSSLPRFLPAAKVEALIDACGTTTATGIRDRAILLLLARLGLRAADIMNLCFDDIDWQQGILRVRGKGRRGSSLPLPQDAGDALLRYLAEARPDVPEPRVFLRALAPYQPFADSHTVSSIVNRALRRAGIDDAPSRGAHMLRHSAATAMLQAGATLLTIGTVLRHRSIDVTGRYAKVDTRALGRIAQPWPGDASC